MTLATTISAPNLALIRATATAESKYWASQYLVAVPHSVVVQFQPSANAASTYAEIGVGSIGSGSMSNIKSYQTVIFSTTTDYTEENAYRTYVRKVDGATALYVGQASQTLTTSMYVTVLNQYDIFEKPRVMRNDVQYTDWDVSFRRLLPVESDLPTAIVLTDGATAWSPTANPQEMDNDATTTFTHAWESSNGSDSLDSGGTTASPSWTLQANAFRWIRYTFIDSNGNANIRVIALWTVPKDLSSQVFLGFVDPSSNVANISYAQGSGWSCDIPAADNNGDIYITSLNKGQMVCIFSVETYNATRGSIEDNIDFVGFLGNEVTRTEGNANFGNLSETRFTVNGFATKLQTTPISPVPINNVAGPSAWDEIENPTPARVITYLLTEYTTISHLCAIRVPSDHTDFIGDSNVFRSDFNIVSEALQYQADAFDGIIQYSHGGIIDVTRNLVQLDSTARDAADTVAALMIDDGMSWDIEVDPDQKYRFLQVYSGVFNTTSGTYSLYAANVPPVPDIRGVQDEQRPNIILTTDLSDANARSELAQRAANLYAALNPTVILRVTLKDQWRFLQPDVGAWYTLTVAQSKTVRGWTFDSNTRWQLLEIGYTTNNETGRKEVQATFRMETSNTGANVEVFAVEANAANEINALPGVLPPFSGADLGFTGGNWFDTLDTEPSSFLTPPGVDCERVGFRPKDGLGTETERAALSGEAMRFTVSGSGLLQAAIDTTDDFSSSAGSWTATPNGGHLGANSTIATGTGGSYTGSLFTHDDITRTSDGALMRICQIDIDFGSIKKFTAFEATYNITKGTIAGGAQVVGLYYSTDGVTYTGLTAETASEVMNGTGNTLAYESTTGVSARYLSVFTRSSLGAYDGSVEITEVTYTAPARYGDALYEWSDGITGASPYGSGDGFLINAAQPVSIPSYNDGHTYTLEDPSVAAGAVAFDFESPYPLSEAEYWSLQVEACFLGV